MNLKHSILINAPISVVWGVTIDVESWPEWSPTFVSIRRLEEGPPDVGSSALIKQPRLPDAKWVVTSFNTEERFTWETRACGTHTIATHALRLQESETESVLRIEMTGVITRLMWPLIRVFVGRSLKRENEGLKKRCEEPDRT